jgi:hypothetical protein
VISKIGNQSPIVVHAIELIRCGINLHY